MGANIVDANMMPAREKVKDAGSRQRQRRRCRHRRQQNRNSVNTTGSLHSKDIHSGGRDSNTDDNLGCESARKQPLQMFLDELLNERPFTRTSRSLITSTIEEEEDDEDVDLSGSESSSSSSSANSSRRSGQSDEQKSTGVSTASWKIVSDTARIPHRGLQSKQFMPPPPSSSPFSPSVTTGSDDKVDDRWSPSISPSKSIDNDRSSSASMPAIPYRRRDREFDHELDVNDNHDHGHGHGHKPDRSLKDDIIASVLEDVKKWSITEAESEVEGAVETKESLTSQQKSTQLQQQDEDETNQRVLPIRSYSFDHILTFPFRVLNDHHRHHRHHLEQEQERQPPKGFDNIDICDMRLTTEPKKFDATSTSAEIFRQSRTGTYRTDLVTSNIVDDDKNKTSMSNRSRELLERSILIASKSM
mmetsp:Transcript_42938/g.103811  ORF Transcript_42938/g.103811 Transcript_42938/m.103811 type:complete len:417 (-) Transcript_42938:8-1258(-)